MPEKPQAFYNLSRLKTAIVWGSAVLLGLVLLSLNARYNQYLVLEQMDSTNFADPKGLAAAAEASDTYLFTVSFIRLFFTFAVIIPAGFWILRAAKNARQLAGKKMKFKPGWALGWFFIPVANLWMPYLALREIWTVSASRAGEERSDGNFILMGWWLFWVLFALFGVFGFWYARLNPAREDLWLIIASGALYDLAFFLNTVFFILIVREITDFQQK